MKNFIFITLLSSIVGFSSCDFGGSTCQMTPTNYLIAVKINNDTITKENIHKVDTLYPGDLLQTLAAVESPCNSLSGWSLKVDTNIVEMVLSDVDQKVLDLSQTDLKKGNLVFGSECYGLGISAYLKIRSSLKQDTLTTFVMLRAVNSAKEPVYASGSSAYRLFIVNTARPK